jgi:putative transcriptional regulator
VTESLGGKLLIASPSLGDFFHRTVVLVVDHDEEGAFGLVLNRPSESTVGEAVPGVFEDETSEQTIHIGGPVQPSAVTAIAEHDDPGDATKLVVGPVGMVDLDSVPDIARVKVFAGYTGWGPGQLDAEIEAEGWIIGDARPEDPFSEGDLWADALDRMGGEYALLARMPADPALN